VEAPLALTDDKGRTWEFPKPVARVVSLTPSLTECLFAIGAGDQVVGVTDYCDYPPEAKERERIGGFKTPSQEKIVALDVDVVFAARGTPEPVVDDLIATGLKVFAVSDDTVDHLFRTLDLLGQITGRAETSDRLRASLRERREAVLHKTRSLGLRQRPRVLYVIWSDPLFTAGPGSYVDDLVRDAGGLNVAGDAESAWPQYSLEAAIAKDPQALVMTSGPMSGMDVVREKKLRELGQDERWRNVAAVRAGRLIVLDEDLLGVPGPRLIDGLEQLAQALHPELFRGSRATAGSRTGAT